MAIRFIRCCTPLTHFASFTLFSILLRYGIINMPSMPSTSRFLPTAFSIWIYVASSTPLVLRHKLDVLLFINGSRNCFRRLLMKLLATVIGLFSSCFSFFQAILLCVRYFSPQKQTLKRSKSGSKFIHEQFPL